MRRNRERRNERHGGMATPELIYLILATLVLIAILGMLAPEA